MFYEKNLASYISLAFGHLMRRVDSLEKTLMVGGIGGRRRRGQQRWDGWMASLTRWMWVWVNSGSWWCTGRPGVLRFMGSQRVGHDWATELNWTELNALYLVNTQYMTILMKCGSFNLLRGLIPRNIRAATGLFICSRFSNNLFISPHSLCLEQKGIAQVTVYEYKPLAFDQFLLCSKNWKN